MALYIPGLPCPTPPPPPASGPRPASPAATVPRPTATAARRPFASFFFLSKFNQKSLRNNPHWSKPRARLNATHFLSPRKRFFLFSLHVVNQTQLFFDPRSFHFLFPFIRLFFVPTRTQRSEKGEMKMTLVRNIDSFLPRYMWT